MSIDLGEGEREMRLGDKQIPPGNGEPFLLSLVLSPSSSQPWSAQRLSCPPPR